jgi:hypothetical protein
MVIVRLILIFFQIFIFVFKSHFIYMSIRHEQKVPKVYSIQVSGIRCTNCAGKIKKALT